LDPVAGDAASVPAQQGLRCDDPAIPEPAGERGDRAEERPVRVGDRWSVDLSSQHLELVAEHDDLKVLGAA
jgi:hypothetical protein